MSKSIKEYRVVYGSSPSELTNKVGSLLIEGFEPVGSHQVVVRHSQNRYRGDQHIDTQNELEYSQTLMKVESVLD
jgi:Domain of unknown function (DUF1737)